MWKEQHLYGSSRLGMWQPEKVLSGVVLPMLGVCGDGQGVRLYELTNHLGNVLATINDKGKVVSAQDYYPFGMSLPGRIYPADGSNTYRYSFNGKEYEGSFKQQDYGMRIYRFNLGRFLSVDPLSKKYPFYTPYQFAGNMPTKFIDLDGLEPAEPGKKSGDNAVATKKGTTSFYSWDWSLNNKTKKWFWKQGSSTMYQNGDIAHVNSHDDHTKVFFPQVQVKPIGANQEDLEALKDMGIKLDPDNNLNVRLNDFTSAFQAGTKLESAESQGEAIWLSNTFIYGNGKSLDFVPGTNISRMLGEDPAFTNLANIFELSALAYYARNKTIEGFKGGDVLKNLGNPYIKDKWFMYTVLGGTQQWNAQITRITANEIRVRYTVYDRFGAGTDDATSRLPGLPSLYWLQHNSAQYYPSTSKMFTPFTWSITVNR